MTSVEEGPPPSNENRQKYQFRYLEKGVLAHHWAVTTKMSQIERSVFFSAGPQGTNSSLQTGLGSNGCSVAEKT